MFTSMHQKRMTLSHLRQCLSIALGPPTVVNTKDEKKTLTKRRADHDEEENNDDDSKKAKLHLKPLAPTSLKTVSIKLGTSTTPVSSIS